MRGHSRHSESVTSQGLYEVFLKRYVQLFQMITFQDSRARGSRVLKDKEYIMTSVYGKIYHLMNHIDTENNSPRSLETGEP